MSSELHWDDLLEPTPESDQPDPEAETRSRRRRRLIPRVRSRRWLVVAAAVVVLAGAGGVAFAATGSETGRYRTAAVTRATVEQTLDSTGTISAVNRADLSFPVSGTVDSVSVKVGQQVHAGQTLATLSDSSLQQQVLSAKSSLASAQAKLTADQTSESTGTASAASSGSSGAAAASSASPGSSATATASALTSPTTRASATLVPAALDTAAVVVPTAARIGSSSSGPSSADPTSAARGRVQQAQSALTASVSKADGLLTQVRGIIGSEQSACSSFLGQLSSVVRSGSTTIAPTTYRTSSASSAGSSSSAQRSASAKTSGSSSPGSSSSGPSGSTSSTNGSQCASLINEVLNLQSEINGVQQTVKTQITALNSAVSSLLRQLGSSSPSSSGNGRPSGGSSSGSSSGTRPSGSSGSGFGSAGSSGSSAARSSGTRSSGSGSGSSSRPGNSGGGQVATAEDVAADQAAVDAAQLQVAVAEQAERQAKLVSPIDGTVGSLDLTTGSTVSSGSSSSTPSVVVVGPGGYEVSTIVTDLDLDRVKVGNVVHVTPDETGRPIDGTVTSIGILPTSSGSSSSSTSGGSATYPVTIALSGDDITLHSGTSADVAIVLVRATSVVAVPTSAVHRLGGGSFVDVLRGGKSTAVRVTLGAAGRELTQISTGLQVGDRVVLANLDASIPTSSSQTSRGLGLGGRSGGSGAGGGSGFGGGAGFGRTGGGSGSGVGG